MFVAWRLELLLANHAKTARTKEFISAWRLFVANRLRSKEYDSISHLKCARMTKRRAFSKLRNNVMIMQKIKRCYTSSREKSLKAGLGHLRIFLSKVLMRQVFEDWVEYTITERNCTMAMVWRSKKMKRGIVRTLLGHARSEIAERRKVRRAALIRRRVLDSRQATEEKDDVDAVVLKERTERNKDLRRQREAARLIKDKMNRQIEEDMLRQQREERRHRVMSERRERDERFNVAWALKKSEVEHKCRLNNAAWRSTAEFKDMRRKELAVLSRQLSPRQASTKEREEALASPGIVAYTLLDSKLAQEGITPDELFDRLSGRPSSSHVIGATSFQAALLSLGLKIKESIFDDLAEYNPIERGVRGEDLREMRRLANTHLGKEGCRWKLYVDAIHRQLLLHDVWDNTFITQKGLKRKHLRKVAEDQLLDCKMLDARQRLYGEKRLAHSCMLRNHAATSIQSMFWQWRARRERDKNRWKIERRKLIETRKLQIRAAVLIQKRFSARSSNSSFRGQATL